MLVVLYAPHFTAGVVFDGDSIERCAPIVHWMKKQNWSLDDIRNHCEKKHWQYTVIYPDVTY